MTNARAKTCFKSEQTHSNGEVEVSHHREGQEASVQVSPGR